MDSRKDLSYLLEEIASIPPAYERSIAHISLDSRDMLVGGLFFAKQGSLANGEAYQQQAIEQGAIAVIYQSDSLTLAHQGYTVLIGVPDLERVIALVAARFYDYPANHLDIIGITGTNGKTTISQLCAQLLDRLGHRCGIIGTLGWGFFGQLTASVNTTPDAIQLQRQLAQLKQQGAQAVAMEISSHALAQQRVAGLPVDVAVFSNLSRDHLDYHGSMEDYGASKQKLFAFPSLMSAVINLDDPFGLHLVDYCHGRVAVRGYGLSGLDAPVETSLIADNLVLREHGVSALLHWHEREYALHSPLLGQFNLANVLAALQAILALGYELTALLALVPELVAVVGRMQSFVLANGATVVVDFAHSPDALHQALLAVRPHCQGRLACVFGCGGDRDAGKRPMMGAIAAAQADWLILTNDNPRTESPELILQQIYAGVGPEAQCQLIPDRALAIRTALQQLQPGDLLLIAGKGHEDYQQIGSQKWPFSDQQQVLNWLQEQQP